jgi:flagellar biosynthetic protein FliO
MTTSARLLTILSLSLPLAACAAAQPAKPGQDGQAGGTAAAAAASSAAPSAPSSAPSVAPPAAPAAQQQSTDTAPASPGTAAAQPRGVARTAPAAAPSTVPAPAANAPALDPNSPAAPETTVGGGAANRQITPPAAGPVTMPASSATGSLLQTLFALIVVLGVLGALAWFLKRYGPKAMGGSANLRVVGSLNLGGRERLLVVEIGNQWIVVGASPGRVNALATMPKQESADMAGTGATLAPHSPPANSFADWLKQTIDKRK